VTAIQAAIDPGPSEGTGIACPLASAGRFDGPARQISSLTARELAVLAMLGSGSDNRAIARELEISEATVKAHITKVLVKLQVTSRLQAALVAAHHGVSCRGTGSCSIGWHR
jgi:DNA-binding NarL/FixJ family response regulator